MSSRKKGKNKPVTAPDASKKQNLVDDAKDASNKKEKDDREGLGSREGEKAGGLKGFVKKMEGRGYLMVEMRLSLVGACGVAFRLLFSDDLSEREQTAWSALCLVIGQVSLL